MLFRGLFLYLPHPPNYWYGELVVKISTLNVMELYWSSRTKISANPPAIARPSGQVYTEFFFVLVYETSRI